MVLNLVSFDEVFFFLRYKSFPILLSIIFLSLWPYLFWAYLTLQKNKAYLFLSLATLSLFIKELILFFATRRITFDLSLERISYSFKDWASIETFFNCFFIIFVLIAFRSYRPAKKFSYPTQSSLFESFMFMAVNVALVVTAILSVYLISSFKGIELTIFLPLITVMQFIILYNRVRITQKNFYPYSGSLMSVSPGKFFSLSLSLFVIVNLVFFIISAIHVTSELQNKLVFLDKALELSETYLHSFKSLVHLVYAIFVFSLLIGESRRLQNLNRKESYLNASVANMNNVLRHGMLTYVSPEEQTQYLLKEVAAYTQAEHVFLVYRTPSDALKFQSLKNSEFPQLQEDSIRQLVEAGKSIILDQLGELSKNFAKHYTYVNKAYTEAMRQYDTSTDKQAIPNEFLEMRIQSLLFCPIQKENKFSYAIVAINKRKDYFESWSEASSYNFIEKIATISHANISYIFDHEQFLQKRESYVHTCFGQRLSSAVSTIEKRLLTGQPQSGKNFAVASLRAYEKLPRRSYFYYSLFQKKPFFFFFEPVGNIAEQFLLAVMIEISLKNALQNEKTISALLKRINNDINPLGDSSFATASCGMYDSEKRVFLFSSAAHEPLLVYHSATKEIISYEIEGPPLGSNPDIEFLEGKIDINEGDILIFHSEELSRIQDGKQPFYDPTAIGKVLKQSKNSDPEVLADALKTDLESKNLKHLQNQAVLLLCRLGK